MYRNKPECIVCIMLKMLFFIMECLKVTFVRGY